LRPMCSMAKLQEAHLAPFTSSTAVRLPIPE
jgi:hypothetical protein